jgi:hypothetical protein
MKLDSFRQLLIKRAVDPQVELMVKLLDDHYLCDMVVESLEKMARAKSKGSMANFAVRHLGTEMDPETEPSMIHDSLSHHASRYKAALENGRKDLANKHAAQIFKTVDLADQMQMHSHGKLHVEAVSPHAWERNAKTSTFTADSGPVQAGRKKVGQFVNDTKGWRYRGKDYGFLQQEPHPSYEKETRIHGHTGPYPIEHIRINGKHLHIDDIGKDDLKGFESHPFDHHPIMEHFEQSAAKRSPDRDKEYVQAHEAYQDSNHVGNFFDKHEQLAASNPEGYAQRGSQPSNPVHSSVAGKSKSIQSLDIGLDTPEDSKTKTTEGPHEDEEAMLQRVLEDPTVSERIKSILRRQK